MVDTLVGEDFGTSDHNSISFKIVMEKARTGPKSICAKLGES